VNVCTSFAESTAIAVLDLLHHMQIAILSQEIQGYMRVSLMSSPEAVPLPRQWSSQSQQKDQVTFTFPLSGAFESLQTTPVVTVAAK